MKRNRVILVAGLVVALFLAGIISYYASSAPDGLNRVAIDKGLDTQQRTSATDGSPLAGYSVKGVESSRLSRGLAGVAGVAICFLVAGGITVVVRRRAAAEAATSGPAAPADSVRT